MALHQHETNRVPLYTASQCRQLDLRAAEVLGISGYELMERAAAAAFAELQGRWPDARRILVLCGTGNNGGDGLVLARLARQAGYSVRVVQLGDPGRRRGEALRAAEDLQAVQLEPQAFVGVLPSGFDVIVDAMLGTGLERFLEGAWKDAVVALNQYPAPCLALDIPTGLHADRGVVLGDAVRAAATVTFIARKQGLYTADAPDCTGQIRYADLAVPAAVYAGLEPASCLLQQAPLGKLSQPRPRTAHKGLSGHILVVGGERGMPGAVRLAAEAALRCGAGLVTVATCPDHAASLPMARPELMCHGVTRGMDLAPLLARTTVVAVGPGLGQGGWGQSLFSALLETDLPLVVDADGLTLLAQNPLPRGRWILTPHPAEAARLLAISTPEVMADRFAAVRDLAQRYDAVVVLKGAGSLIGTPAGDVVVCPLGNPGMASGGMGDVLTGVIAALLGQGLEAWEAAQAGTWLHAAAGDRVAQAGERGLLASDLLLALRAELNGQ